MPWAKTNGRPAAGGFRNQAEYVVWGTKGASRKDNPAYLPGVLSSARVAEREKVHVTQKPPSILEDLMGVTREGEVVLDPFAGSGSTGVAALRHGRSFIGIEMSDDYAHIARRRLEAALAEVEPQPDQLPEAA